MNELKRQENDNNLSLTGRAIINNNNYTITTNNDYIINSCTPEARQISNEGLSDPTGIASRDIPASQPGEVICSQEGNLQNLYTESTIPANWEYIKLDLYNNASTEELIQGKNKFKLAINIKKSGQAGWMSFMAGLNSELRFMKRGLDALTWETGHYLNVRESYAVLKSEYGFARASKTYAKGYRTKGQTIEELSVVIAPGKEGEYYVNLHYQEQQWVWILKGGAHYLSKAQRKNNIIATAGVKRGNKVKNLRAGDLLS
jgi:hypothetical protein